MKITIRELMEKIDGINRTIDAIHNYTTDDACVKAIKYLDEYVDMLKDAKVDI